MLHANHGNEIDDAVRKACARALATRRPGYLVPRLVREVPGAASKRELAPAYLA